MQFQRKDSGLEVPVWVLAQFQSQPVDSSPNLSCAGSTITYSMYLLLTREWIYSQLLLCLPINSVIFFGGKGKADGLITHITSQVLIRKIQTGCFKVTFLEEVETAILQISLIYLGEKDLSEPFVSCSYFFKRTNKLTKLFKLQFTDL